MRLTTFLWPVLLAFVLLLPAPPSDAEVEWQEQGSFRLPSAPVDMATSADGQQIFILLPGGELRIYDAAGREQERLSFGQNADRIVVSPDGTQLLLSDNKGKQVRLVSLDYVKPIDISGSPAKGPEDAKVVVAVYSDFQ